MYTGAGYRFNLASHIDTIDWEKQGPIPESLGEDRLARFGAYREFE